MDDNILTWYYCIQAYSRMYVFSMLLSHLTNEYKGWRQKTFLCYRKAAGRILYTNTCALILLSLYRWRRQLGDIWFKGQNPILKCSRGGWMVLQFLGTKVSTELLQSDKNTTTVDSISAHHLLPPFKSLGVLGGQADEDMCQNSSLSCALKSCCTALYIN